MELKQNNCAVLFVIRNNSNGITLVANKISEIKKTISDFESYLTTGTPKFGRYSGADVKSNSEAIFEEVVIDFEEVIAVKLLARLEK
jgi:hypothetical protein